MASRETDVEDGEIVPTNSNTTQKPRYYNKLLSIGEVLGKQQGLPQLAMLNAVSKTKFVPEQDTERMKGEYFADITNMSLSNLAKLCDELYEKIPPDQLNKRRGIIDRIYYETRAFPFSPYDGYIGRGFQLKWDEKPPSELLDELTNVQKAFARNDKNVRQYYTTIYKALTDPITGGKKSRKSKKSKKSRKSRKSKKSRKSRKTRKQYKN